MKKKNIILQCGILILTLLAFLGYLGLRNVRTDTIAPELTIVPGIPEFSVADDRQQWLQGVTARDDRDGDVTDRILVESVYGITPDHQVTVTYAAFDRAGNVTTEKRQIRFTDYHSPRFSLKNALVFPANSGTELMDYIGAEDIFDGDVDRWIRATMISNSTGLTNPGTYDVHLKVTNSLGDTAELTLPVEVYDDGKYDTWMTLESYLVYLPVGAAFDGRSLLGSMGCGDATISLRMPGNNVRVSVSGNVDTGTPGVYPVTYTARYTDDADVTFTAYTRAVVVVEE